MNQEMPMPMPMGNSTCTYRMYMHFFKEKDYKFYFDNFKVDSNEKYAGAVIAMLFFSIGIQLLPLIIKFIAYKSEFSNSKIVFKLFISFIYFLYAAGSYLLMLAIMSYSTGIFLAVCFGLTIGYFITETFKPKYLESNEIMRACH